MIRRLLLATSLFVSSINIVQAQQTLIDKVNFDEKTILVGMAADYNTDKSYEKYNFFINDAKSISGIKLNLEHGYELENKVTDSNHFMIYAIKDRKIVDQWLVNPRLYNVFNNGIAYSFDADKLENIAKQFPFEYEIELKTFKSEKEYLKAKKAIDLDQKVFLLYEPVFDYEGTFEVSIKKDETFKTPADAETYLRDLVKPTTKKNVIITYALNEKNLKDPSQMTMIVAGPEEVYKKIKIVGHEKSEWKPEIFEATVVRKK
ncbi:hypothetical protein [Faecalibacter bovis]|uniref:Uncharacterized protein n=1 Tax=Faecalibacter bovis TaxID=2898187 RepID=A0ABX7XAQ6_9FLAO|nr:hypothetical protein [Faecalibacter bovis]MBS7331973.1 hypothetical protein [Weeksellaceae bacterium]QTV04980.1 hypothetical protein J9309_09285 [Faecalibacter bovis]